MKTYKTVMTVLGLSRGDTFSSDDPGWERYVQAGALVVVEEPEPVEPPPPPLLLVFDEQVGDGFQ